MLEINGDEGHVDLAKKLIIQLLSELKRDEELNFQRLKYDADMLERENKDVVKALLDHVIVTTAAGISSSFCSSIGFTIFFIKSGSFTSSLTSSSALAHSSGISIFSYALAPISTALKFIATTQIKSIW